MSVSGQKGTYVTEEGEDVRTTLWRDTRGRCAGGMLSHVFRPMMTAFFSEEEAGEVEGVEKGGETEEAEDKKEEEGEEVRRGEIVFVVLLKKAMSFLSVYHGSPPLYPIARLRVAQTIIE